MGNPKYLKGKRLERKIVNHAVENGIEGHCSAGSKTPIDCTLIDKKRKRIYFVQAKSTKLSQKARERILEALPKPDEYLIKSIVITSLAEFKEFLNTEEKAHTHEEPDTQEPEVLSIENNTHTEKEKDNETKTPPQNI